MELQSLINNLIDVIDESVYHAVCNYECSTAARYEWDGSSIDMALESVHDSTTIEITINHADGIHRDRRDVNVVKYLNERLADNYFQKALFQFKEERDFVEGLDPAFSSWNDYYSYIYG